MATDLKQFKRNRQLSLVKEALANIESMLTWLDPAPPKPKLTLCQPQQEKKA